MRLRNKFQTGDTIVEVIIAIAVIATVLTGAFIVSSRSLTAVRDSQEHSEVLQQLQGQVELLRSAANIPGFFNTTDGTTYGACAFPYTPTSAICVTKPFCLGTDSSGNITGYHSEKPPIYQTIDPSNYVDPNDYYSASLNPDYNPTCFPNNNYDLGLNIIECYPNTNCAAHPLNIGTLFRLSATWVPIGGASFDSVTIFYSVKVSCTGSQPGQVGITCGTDGTEGKPVIYLYPQNPENVSVKLKYFAGFSKTVPAYNSTTGWQVFAKPDGTLLNKADNKIYPYLYWEGNVAPLNIDVSTGFVIAGKDTKQFLALELPIIGLNQNETNAFLAYWIPRMDNNKFNLIHFAGHDYTSLAPLNISPKPDSLLRVNMIFKALQTPIVVTPQTFPVFHRNGFTVVEWGGAELF